MVFLKRSGKSQESTSNPAGFDSLYNNFLKFVDGMTPKARKTWSVLSLIGAALLMGLASLPIAHIPSEVFVLIGFPAGVLVFANFVAFFNFTKMKDWSVAGYKYRVPPSVRIRTVAIFGVIIIVILIIIGGRIPFGVGGAVMVTLVLTALNLIRRTPEEADLARRGIPDPREFAEDNPEDETAADSLPEEDDEEEFLRKPGTRG